LIAATTPFTQNLQALPIEVVNPEIIVLTGPTTSITRTFTLPAPFTDAGWDVVSAIATFTFIDEGGRDIEETFTITLQGGEAQSGGPVPAFGFSATFSPIGQSALDALQDGTLDYTIALTSDPNTNFTITEARLSALIQEVTQQQPVPDGSATATLLGLGCLAMATLRKTLL